MPRTWPPPEERFWAKVDKSGPDGCWVWTATRVNGYGQFVVSPQRTVRAHRYAWELLCGPIPPDLVIDHLCRVRCCVNPAHLELVTEAENIRRGVPYRRPGGYADHRAPWMPPKDWRPDWQHVIDAVDARRP